VSRIDFNALASDFARARTLEPAAIDAWMEAMAPFIPVGGRILDVGAGTGQFAGAMAERFGARVVALEPAAGMLQVARGAGTPAGFEPVRGVAEHLPVRAACFDAAWLSTVIHHFRDLGQCVRELRRVLAAGAAVLVRNSFPGRHGGYTLFRFFPGASRVASTFPALAEVRDCFARAGFRFVSLEQVAQVSAPSLRVARERIALRADTTLRPLSDAEFARGLAAIDEEVRAGRGDGPVVDHFDLLVFR
jgi:ubiquinone/menaquinone biosynthesis C-methylase UbiE